MFTILLAASLLDLDAGATNDMVSASKATTNAVIEIVKSAPEVTTNAVKREARITSRSTVYNRKEGVTCFSGDVFVDDEQYQLHADKIFLFMDQSNQMRRIVALGNVSMTNDTKRAYGAKAVYSKKNGLVVLSSGDGKPAEVRDEAKGVDKAQIVRGKKIRFWIDSEQVEVLEAEISGPNDFQGKTLKDFK